MTTGLHSPVKYYIKNPGWMSTSKIKNKYDWTQSRHTVAMTPWLGLLSARKKDKLHNLESSVTEIMEQQHNAGSRLTAIYHCSLAQTIFHNSNWQKTKAQIWLVISQQCKSTISTKKNYFKHATLYYRNPTNKQGSDHSWRNSTREYYKIKKDPKPQSLAECIRPGPSGSELEDRRIKLSFSLHLCCNTHSRSYSLSLYVQNIYLTAFLPLPGGRQCSPAFFLPLIYNPNRGLELISTLIRP